MDIAADHTLCQENSLHFPRNNGKGRSIIARRGYRRVRLELQKSVVLLAGSSPPRREHEGQHNISGSEIGGRMASYAPEAQAVSLSSRGLTCQALRTCRCLSQLRATKNCPGNVPHFRGLGQEFCIILCADDACIERSKYIDNDATTSAPRELLTVIDLTDADSIPPGRRRRCSR
jgi:hypothetical protein